MSLSTLVQRSNRATLAIALIAAVILGSSAIEDYRTLADKADKQQSALSQINRWKTEYDALKPYQAEWDKTLTATSQITDLYHVYAALHIESHGLKTNQERLIVDKIESIVSSGTPIHASRVCLKTAPENGLSVTAPRFTPDLLDGLKQIAARRDVEINNIQLTTENGTPKALIDLCLIFRT